MNIRETTLKLMSAAMLAALAFSAQAADHKAHWGYDGPHGAKHWGGMEPGFALCKTGKEQSPLDINPAISSKPTPIEFAYAPSAAQLINNGHTIQVNLAAGGNNMLDGVDYSLLQFHFHTPSEEKIRGQAYPMVAHLVHKSASGMLAVLAVLFELGDENPALKEIFAGLPTHEGDSVKLANGFNSTAILPAYKGYYKFVGSLTTPPCSEGVLWQVMKQRVEISKEQLDAFRKLYKMNARPVQPLNGRKIEES
jgi:carbonic anhydrase